LERRRDKRLRRFKGPARRGVDAGPVLLRTGRARGGRDALLHRPLFVLQPDRYRAHGLRADNLPLPAEDPGVLRVSGRDSHEQRVFVDGGIDDEFDGEPKAVVARLLFFVVDNNPNNVDTPSIVDRESRVFVDFGFAI